MGDEDVTKKLLDNLEPEHLEGTDEAFGDIIGRGQKKYEHLTKFPDKPDAKFLTKLFPDASPAQAAQDYAVLMQIKNKLKSGMDMEAAVTSTINSMDVADVRKLSDNFRVDLLQLVEVDRDVSQPVTMEDYDNETPQDKALWTARSRLTFGDDIKTLAALDKPNDYDGRNTSMYSPRFAAYLDGQTKLYEAAEAKFFATNPDMKKIADQWKADPKSVSVEDKMHLMESLHQIHAEINGYSPVPLVKIKDLGGNVMAMYIEPVDSDTKTTRRVMLADEFSLANGSYDNVRSMLLHESDHAAQLNWIRDRNNIPPGDPRWDFFNRAAAYDFAPGMFGSQPGKGFGGPDPFWGLLYSLNPLEMNAFLEHNPNRPEAVPDNRDPSKPRYLPNMNP